MVYVGNNHVGFDANALGFPSILGCQAVVYQTTQGLFGFHDMKGGGVVEGLVSQTDIDSAKAAAFAQFVQGTNIPHQAHARQIYGVINQTQQYGTDQEGVTAWQTMLLGVAAALGFNGPIYGYRVTKHVGKADSIYVRFDAVGTECTISFKRWSKMELDPNNTIALDSNVQQAMGKTSGYGQAPVYVVKDPVEQVRPVLRKVKKNKPTVGEGNLNVIPRNELIQIR